MSSQEVFFSQDFAGKRIQVLKIYDRQFAREAFEQMSEDAKELLASALVADGVLEINDDPTSDDELWEGIQEGAREDWNSFSYFVVCEGDASDLKPLFVSADWPTSEKFAKSQGSQVTKA